MIDEQKLLHNLKKRNRNSLDDIIKIYTPYISVIVYNTVGCKLSKEDMEEIVSDTFFLLWQNSLNIDETKGNMRSYLATIARNTSKNKLRKYHSNEVLNEQIISSDLTPQDNIIKAENSQFLTELITSLGEPDSEIFFRYYYYNEKIKTISKAMNISLSTVILQYGCDIFSVCKNIQLAVRNNVEQYTSINARRINILVKNLRK